MSAINGIARIETVGTLVRGKYGQLARITAVLEHTRCSGQHMTSPNDVVVSIESVGPGYRHVTSWASDLTLAQDGDRFGAHPHCEGCECGEPYETGRQPGWYDMRPSWER